MPPSGYAKRTIASPGLTSHAALSNRYVSVTADCSTSYGTNNRKKPESAVAVARSPSSSDIGAPSAPPSALKSPSTDALPSSERNFASTPSSSARSFCAIGEIRNPPVAFVLSSRAMIVLPGYLTRRLPNLRLTQRTKQRIAFVRNVTPSRSY